MPSLRPIAFLAFLMSILCWTHSALADPHAETRPLRLSEAFRLALERNPQLKAVQTQLLINDANITTANMRLNPYILSDNGIAERSYRLGIQQIFEMGGKRKHRVAVALAQKEVSVSEIKQQVVLLRYQVRNAYTQLYLANERAKTYQSLLDICNELQALAQQREHQGPHPDLDLLQSDVVELNISNELEMVHAEKVNAQSRLNALLNQPLNTPLELAEPDRQLLWTPADTQPIQKAPKMDSENFEAYLLDLAFKNRPEIQANDNNYRVAQQQLKLARVNRIPNLSLTAGPDLVTGPDGGLSAFIIGTAEIPVFNRQQGMIQEALAEQRQISQEKEALKLTVSVEVATAYINYQANLQRLYRYQTQLLPTAIAVREKSRAAFMQGRAGMLEALASQQALVNTQLGYLQAIQEYQTAVSDLERAVGFVPSY